MSRVDLVVDGEEVAAENFSDPEDVTIAIEGGARDLFELANWEHLVVKIGDEESEDSA